METRCLRGRRDLLSSDALRYLLNLLPGQIFFNKLKLNISIDKRSSEGVVRDWQEVPPRTPRNSLELVKGYIVWCESQDVRRKKRGDTNTPTLQGPL